MQEGYANRLPGLATDLVSRNVNVIVASATPAAQAAKKRDQNDTHRFCTSRRADS